MKSEAIGVVVIGRNEGVRLERCLKSVLGRVAGVVYVDSGSTDNSVSMARGMNIEVVELDMSVPFTAARARNEGFERLLTKLPEIRYVQFVDGDCEVVPGWIEKAEAFLNSRPDVAAVCGRRRERFPENSAYNLLCDIEWDTPTGEAKSCGGDALMRADALSAAGGYRPDLIAGEEPELCVRLRAAGWKVWRLGEEMTLHDAAMTRFGQWWKRTQRSGHAYAEGAYLHGAPPERHGVADSRRIWLWGLFIPLAILLAVIVAGWPGLLLAAIYPLQVVRLAIKGDRSTRENWLYAFFLVLGKFPELQGQLKFHLNRLSAGKTTLIEYK
ncbi:MAG: glycosyltransferase family 2 protein [Gammaproteobacteria bacterium]|nr:glycosyltransferase family 2 protein [Gammaproteobacteria bacterium]MBU1415592.1 glycosyltransferase family 2 protein [Gammaproteobacteria bacterium]